MKDEEMATKKKTGKRIVGHAPSIGREKKLLVRFSDEEMTTLIERASAADMSMSHYLRTKALRD